MDTDSNGAAWLEVDGCRIRVDDEGYLLDFSAWDDAVAFALAARDDIELSPEHWQILHVLRDFYQQFQQAPAMRALVKYVGQTCGADKGTSIHLLRLFPGSPAKRAARIAGLPRPEHCL